ncbi:hypothetical protein [Ruegeria hyattellae]|uniref:hypothetical protein n=1 Tax=Ruegeria hyattellae TaxID=3233337 RepID=UPI00355B540E
MATLALILAGFGGAGLAVISTIFLRDLKLGMERTSHHLEQLPQVMGGRYTGMAALALLAALYGDMAVIAGLFLVYAFLGFYDAWVYRGAQRPFMPHLIAGIAAAVVALLALSANGAA